MKDFFKKTADTIVQTVRDYPKGYLIVLGVVAGLGAIGWLV